MNPSFELGAGPNAPPWTLQESGVVDTDAAGRYTGDANTGSFSFRSQRLLGGNLYTFDLRQTVTVVRGASYTVQLFAKQNDPDMSCDLAIVLNEKGIKTLQRPGSSYGAISGIVTIQAGARLQQDLSIRVYCPTVALDEEEYFLFIDDVTMTLVI